MNAGGGAAASGAGHFQKHFYLYLAAITLLGALLRFSGLERVPPGLFRDEAEKGYNAWALTQRGGVIEMDTGAWPGSGFVTFKRFPWMININGTRTSAIYQYVDTLFVGVGGLTVTNTRRAAALMGTLAILLAGLVARRVWGTHAALVVALWITVSPWHIIFSRWAQQSSFVPVFMWSALLGCWGICERKRWGWPLLGAALGWLFYAYSGAQPFVLAWGVCLLILFFKRIKQSRWQSRWPFIALGVLLFLIPVVPTLIITLAPGGATRLNAIALWGNGRSPMQVIGIFLHNYLQHFWPDFLFLKGDSLLRHAMPGSGVMLWIDALLLPAGIVFAFRKQWPLRWVLLTALLCGPLPAAITIEAPHALRAFPQATPAVAFAALGLWWLLGAMHAQLIAHGKPMRAANLYAACTLALCMGLGLSAFARYWRGVLASPGYQIDFQTEMTRAWPRLLAERKPGQRVFYSLFFSYAPYYQLFYERRDPLAVAGKYSPMGLADSGVIYTQGDFATVRSQARPGDWFLLPLSPVDPLAVAATGLQAQDKARVSEAWPYLGQF